MTPRRTLHGEPGWAHAHRLSRRSPKARDTASTPPTRQVPAQTTTPPAASMRLRSSVRLGLWSSDSAIAAQHRNAPLSPVPEHSDAASRYPESDDLLLLKPSASPPFARISAAALVVLGQRHCCGHYTEKHLSLSYASPDLTSSPCGCTAYWRLALRPHTAPSPATGNYTVSDTPPRGYAKYGQRNRC